MSFSLIVPIFNNQDSIPKLLSNINDIRNLLDEEFEAIFVVDGSPDESLNLLYSQLSALPYKAKLISHSKNFGSFAAIKTGLSQTDTDYSATYSADCQEPTSLIKDFYDILATGKSDIVFGTRVSRSDPYLSKLFSKIFWSIYRRLVDSKIPKGGVDVFACNKRFREELLKLGEARSSLISLAFWLGFHRAFVPYKRLNRTEGKSAWSFRRKLRYFSDSLFAFTDLPVRLLLLSGFIGIVLSVILSLIIVSLRIIGDITIPGYSPTILLILFFGALNIFGLGLVGSYAWRSYENSKNRPAAVISKLFEN